jgi:serine/threonine protein kinase
MGNSIASSSPDGSSLAPAFCGPSANLKQLSSFYRKFQMGDAMWTGHNSAVRACRRRGSQKWDHVVKRISRQRIRRLHMEASLSREVMALREFGEHKHVVELVDVCEDDADEVFMVFRHLKGGDLFHNIAKQGRMAEADAQRLVASVASAVRECHDSNWVHRDIKPENILCTSSDMTSCDFQLCDFGFACTQNSVTGSREFVGSAGYQAPEVIMQHDGVSCAPAIDMWGLGCLMYVAVTGSMPFFHRDDRMIEQMTVDGVVDLSEEKVGHLSPDAKDVLARLFAYEASDRMTVGELLEHSWLHGVLPPVPECEPESEPRLVSSTSIGSSRLSEYSNLSSDRSTWSRDSSEESLTDRSYVSIVPPACAVPSDVPEFTRDQLERMSEEMRSFLPVEDRVYHLRTYKKCWLGCDGVAFLAKTLGSERVALSIGDQMIAAGLMRHVAGKHDMENRKLFYRFKDDEDVLTGKPLEKGWEHALQTRSMIGGI